MKRLSWLIRKRILEEAVNYELDFDELNKILKELTMSIFMIIFFYGHFPSSIDSVTSERMCTV